MKQFYRFEFYDKHGKFHHVQIKDDLQALINEKDEWKKLNKGYCRMYKCNERGNNYNGRELFEVDE